MLKYILSFSILIFFGQVSFAQSVFELGTLDFNGKKLRTGILRSSTTVSKGSILYLEGLGDSFMNHLPLFQSINTQGYDVVAFDYLGQGGSEGSMNSTTIGKINQMADLVWNHYGLGTQKKILLGWSTGGLAAYRYAYYNPKKTKAVILMAPGIAPKVWIGENMKITERSLTSMVYSTEESNPHIEPIKPKSPLHVPGFAVNLLYTAKLSKYWKISSSVKGLVLLSSEKDTYVNSKKTESILGKNANHFNIVSYQGTGALHELDNEKEEVAMDVRLRITEFLQNIE